MGDLICDSLAVTLVVKVHDAMATSVCRRSLRRGHNSQPFAKRLNPEERSKLISFKQSKMSEPVFKHTSRYDRHTPYSYMSFLSGLKELSFRAGYDIPIKPYSIRYASAERLDGT